MSSDGKGSVTNLSIALMAQANSENIANSQEAKPKGKKSKTPKKSASGSAKSTSSKEDREKKSSVKAKADKNPKIKEILSKEILLMELAKKVHNFEQEVDANKLKDVEMENCENKSKAKSDTDEIGDLLSEKKDKEEKLSYSQERSKQMKMKKHSLNLDEARNLVEKVESLPFKI